MTVNVNLNDELRTSLFELACSLDKLKRKDLIEALCLKLEQLTGAKQVHCLFYNKWNMEKQAEIFFADATHPYEIIGYEDLFANFESNALVTKTDQLLDPYETYIIKLPSHDNIYNLILFSFQKGNEIDEDQLVTLCSTSSRYLKLMYNDRNRKYIRRRAQYFFRLSTELHSVHKTTEVISQLYTTFQKLYPFFGFSLLMSQDYDCEDVPISLIEYSGEQAQSSGTMAFIENTIKIDYDHAHNSMVVYAPLAGKQGVYGVVKILISKIMDKNELELELITQFTNMAGMAIERTTLFQSSNRQVTDLQLINHASHELNVKLESTDIIDILKRYIVETSSAEEVGVVICNSDNFEEPGSDVEVMKGSTDYFYSNSGMDLIHYLKKALDKDSNPILSGNFKTIYQELPYHSLMVIPMWNANAIFGFVIMLHPLPYYFTFDKFKFTQSFVQHASLAFKNSVLTAQLRNMAITDYLTKLYSRSYLDDVMTEHINTGEQGVFVLLDIDDFKLINDTYGHHTGDKILIKVSEIIKRNTDKVSATASRWGGEEFAIYFPEETIENTSKIIEQIRTEIFEQSEPSVTFSCGISAWDAINGISSIEKLFIHADEALYQAKSSGKNKTVYDSLCYDNNR